MRFYSLFGINEFHKIWWNSFAIPNLFVWFQMVLLGITFLDLFAVYFDFRYTDRRKNAVLHFQYSLSMDPLLWAACEELCILGLFGKHNVSLVVKLSKNAVKKGKKTHLSCK